MGCGRCATKNQLQAIAEEIRMSQLTSHVIYRQLHLGPILGAWVPGKKTRDSIWARSAAVYGDRLPNFQQTFDPFVTSCEITHLQ